MNNDKLLFTFFNENFVKILQQSNNSQWGKKKKAGCFAAAVIILEMIKVVMTHKSKSCKSNATSCPVHRSVQKKKKDSSMLFRREIM